MPDAAVLVEPAYLWVPEHASTSGDIVADFAELIGQGFDVEQRLAVDAICAERADGRWAAFEAAVIAPRQNLKTHVLKILALAHVTVLDADLVMWSAHLVPTALKAFEDLKQIIEEHDFLSRRVKRIVDTNGQESIEFHGHREIIFKARTKTGARGLTGDVVVLDEAFALTAAHLGTIMPTMSARSMHGNPQMLYGSSAGLVGSEVLRTVRDRGRRGDDPSLAYVEWCAPVAPCAMDECDHIYGIRDGCQLDDRENWRRANPAKGRRISEEFIQAERRALPPNEFARERMGWWEDPVADVGFDLEQWEACGDAKAEPSSPTLLALDVNNDSTSAAIVACGGGVVKMLEHRKGTKWLVPRLVELCDELGPLRVGVDGTGPAKAVLQALADAGFREDDPKQTPESDRWLVNLSAPQNAEACALLVGGVVDGTFVHRNEPVLNLAVVGAAKSQSGDSWRWSRRNSTVDITPLVGATVAHYLWHTHAEQEVVPWIDFM